MGTPVLILDGRVYYMREVKVVKRGTRKKIWVWEVIDCGQLKG